MEQEAGKYKALLFTDKPKTPLMWRGVSVDLKGKMTLGVVQKDDKGVCSRYKVTKFPQILVVKPGQKKPIKFDGKLTDIREIFEFLNKYQETFAMENSAADEELAQKKPWLSEAVPELTSLSAQDVCYGADAWCVIVAGKRGADGKLEKSVLDTVIASKSKHASGSVKVCLAPVAACVCLSPLPSLPSAFLAAYPPLRTLWPCIQGKRGATRVMALPRVLPHVMARVPCGAAKRAAVPTSEQGASGVERASGPCASTKD